MTPSRWPVPSLVCAVAFSGFSAVHLIDDFLAEVPFEFHLTVPTTEFLALAYMIALVGLIAAASRQSPAGYLGLAIGGLLITLAQLTKSLPEILRPGPWRLGPVSEVLALGLGVAALLTAITSYLAWRAACSSSWLATTRPTSRGGSWGWSSPDRLRSRSFAWRAEP